MFEAGTSAVRLRGLRQLKSSHVEAQWGTSASPVLSSILPPVIPRILVHSIPLVSSVTKLPCGTKRRKNNNLPHHFPHGPLCPQTSITLILLAVNNFSLGYGRLYLFIYFYMHRLLWGNIDERQMRDRRIDKDGARISLHWKQPETNRETLEQQYYLVKSSHMELWGGGTNARTRKGTK